jgi:hypothetical protein
MPVAGLVRASARADVHDRLRPAQRRVDQRGDPRIFAACRGVPSACGEQRYIRPGVTDRDAALEPASAVAAVILDESLLVVLVEARHRC